MSLLLIVMFVAVLVLISITARVDWKLWGHEEYIKFFLIYGIVYALAVPVLYDFGLGLIILLIHAANAWGATE